jgi:hypothetical protein
MSAAGEGDITFKEGIRLGRCHWRCAQPEIAARLVARHRFPHRRKVRQRVWRLVADATALACQELSKADMRPPPGIWHIARAVSGSITVADPAPHVSREARNVGS